MPWHSRAAFCYQPTDMARWEPLVCQHLENLSRHALEKYHPIIRDYVRRRHGVYALYRRGKLYYVGLASNLRSRLRHHLKDRHGGSWDRFSVYLTIGDKHIRELESLVLRIVPTKGNKQRGRLIKSENLAIRFRRDMRERWRHELEDLLGHRAPPKVGRQAEDAMQGRRPILASYVSGPIKLRAKFKGQTLRARVRRNGEIRFRGKLYTSPSKAASAACGRATCNGWWFWKYERAPGDWVRLRTLRH